jgi:uncharacterized protein RhaS with RHS repeats
MGRWINRDPIGEAGGLNLYAALNNSPTNRSDAYGHVGYVITGGTLVILGALVLTATGLIIMQRFDAATLQQGLLDIQASGGTVCEYLYRSTPEGLYRDGTGKVHGDLPSVQDLKDLPIEELQHTIEELWKSIKHRKQENDKKGHDPAHQRRVGEEENLVRSLEKVLRGRS